MLPLVLSFFKAMSKYLLALHHFCEANGYQVIYNQIERLSKSEGIWKFARYNNVNNLLTRVPYSHYRTITFYLDRIVPVNGKAIQAPLDEMVA